MVVAATFPAGTPGLPVAVVGEADEAAAAGEVARASFCWPLVVVAGGVTASTTWLVDCPLNFGGTVEMAWRSAAAEAAVAAMAVAVAVPYFFLTGDESETVGAAVLEREAPTVAVRPGLGSLLLPAAFVLVLVLV